MDHAINARDYHGTCPVRPKTLKASCRITARVVPERWRSIPGWPGYEIDILTGRVISCKRAEPRELATNLDRYGYRRLTLSQPGARWPGAHVHRLVMMAALGRELREGEYVLHQDGDQLHNSILNLYVGDPVQNYADSLRHGTASIGVRRPRAKLTDAAVIQMRREYAAGGVTLTELGRRYGVGYSCVQRAVRGDAWRHVEEAQS